MKQKGGGLFGSDDEPAKEASTVQPTPPAEPSLIDKFTNAFKGNPEEAKNGEEGSDAVVAAAATPDATPAASLEVPSETTTEEDPDNKSTLDKIKGFFTGDKKEGKDESGTESEDESGSGSESEDSEIDAAEAAAPVAAAAAVAAPVESTTVSSPSESESSESESEDENDELTFTNFEREIKTLRDKYDKLKQENRQLKADKKDDSSNGKKDNSEFSKIIASFFAIEGSVAQMKLSLKKHADQNGFPVDGLGLDDAETGSMPASAAPATQPEVAPVDVPQPVQSESTDEMNTSAALAAGTGATAAMAAAPVVADQLSSTNNETAQAAPAIPELDSSSESGSGSESDESDIEEIPVNQNPSMASLDENAAQAPAPAPAQAPASEPAALEPASASAPIEGEPGSGSTITPPTTANAAPGQGKDEYGLFSGGKNHYLHSLKKNKTHRHHKRRNRHQTLRK
jgi:hypothetical protein